MRANFTQLYVHCVWATWDRLPLITPDIQKEVYADIIRQCDCLDVVRSLLVALKNTYTY